MHSVLQISADPKLSVVINTFNEEGNIAGCISSIQGIADEIIVCDMYSSDRTVEIARQLGARIMMHEKEQIVEPARYAAISQATHSWILVMDADERMIPSTAEKIAASIRGEHDVIYLWCNNLYFGKYMKHGGFFFEIPRCFRKQLYLSSYSEAESRIHMNFSGIREQGVAPLHLPEDCYFEHLAYPTIERYVVKTIGYYARVEANQEYLSGRRFSVLRLFTKPVKSFIEKYFFLKGYKDGTRGLILCVLYSFYEFTMVANVWMLEDQHHRGNGKG